MMPSKDSKSNFAELRKSILEQNGKAYWRSVEEFVDAPEFEEFVKQEYPSHAEEWDDSLSRRNFIKVMGASLAFAGLSGCVIQPAEKIVPYVRQPEEIVPGKSLYYATAMTLGGVAVGLLARSNEGRPIKIEGNPDHPGSLGATDVRAQAALLNMYDPDRSQQVLNRNNPSTWENFSSALRAAAEENRGNGGAGIRFLSETVSSPTLAAQFKQISAELPNSRWYQYEPINNDNATAGAKMAFGSPVQTVYKFDQADRILSLDEDFLSDFTVRYAKDFAKKRFYHSEEKKDISRMYVVETSVTITGAKADHRLPVKPSQLTNVAKAIAAALGVGGAAPAAGLTPEMTNWISAMAKDLLANRGKSIVVAGKNAAPTVHALAHAMNSTLGNVGTTVVYTDPLQPNAEMLQSDAIKQLIGEIDAGTVKMLVILGGNPVYNTPIDARLTRERMDKIPFRVHLVQFVDETAEVCHWHVSEKHFLESWGDSRAYDGTVTLTQPLIQPLYDSKNIYEVVQLFLKENFDKKDQDIVKEFWQKQGIAAASKTSAAVAGTTQNANTAAVSVPSSANNNANAQAQPKPTPAAAASTPVSTAGASQNFEDQWRKVVHDGFIADSALPTRAMTAGTGFLTQPETVNQASGGVEISIRPDPNIWDGRFANNGWLQELPKPLTKTTWDNVAYISPKTAQRFGLNQNREYNAQTGAEEGTSFINTKGGNLFSDLVKVSYQGAEIGANVPVWIIPGQPDDVITLFTGYGRSRAGRVGSGIGYNAFDVSRTDAMWNGVGDLKVVGDKATIASTQTHFNMEGRDILRSFDVEEFNKNPAAADQPNEYDTSMYPGFQYNGNKWGMTVDLNSCVGCNACVIACQSENNIPVVGKEQVERSREMHWMRIDAYYTGDDLNNPDGLHFQPVLCQQCEQAPCEVVCPVHATTHSAEGLNDMTYNRCVGTRYCSNNCPYKVRRFNFLLYQDWNTPQYKLMRNPEVTVRSRGVMEKCTYCTQRIASARIEAEKDGRNIRDGEIVTACQSVCPTNAITFGDLNDANSAVTKSRKDHRNYTLLNNLNTQPRTTYLAELKNQNQEMPDYVVMKMPESSAEKSNDARTGEETEPKH
ncbi:MAG: TAT-variant-translocated molybdopterin oxidoreductase [Pyrinomonadaceae bacterium]